MDDYEIMLIEKFGGVKFPKEIPDPTPEENGKIREAREIIRKWICEENKRTICLLCNKRSKIIGSHVIKNEILKSISSQQKLLTLNSDAKSFYSVLTEDRSSIAAKKAFKFWLICHSCDDNFSYEDKAKIKETFNSDELRSIALKVRLKTLHDNYERLAAVRYRPRNERERSMIEHLGNSELTKSRIADEEIEIKKIYRKRKSYVAFKDDFLDFRIPFAMEMFLSPRVYPRSREIIPNNSIMSIKPDKRIDRSGCYVMLQPSSDPLDDWSRLTVLYDEHDEVMIKWFEMLARETKIDTRSLSNTMISYHINVNSNNFAMSPNISDRFLSAARDSRYQHNRFEPTIWRHWISLL